jgi:hypothetical protein
MLVELYETNNIATLQLVKSLLKINDIDHEIMNENTLQIGSLEAMGIQGAIVKVDANSYERAKELMIENKFMSSKAAIEEESAFVKWVNENFDFAFLKGQPFYIKLLIIVAVLLIILGAIIFLLVS